MAENLPDELLAAARAAPTHHLQANAIQGDELARAAWASAAGRAAAEEAVRLRPDRALELAAWLVASAALRAVGREPEPAPSSLRPVHHRRPVCRPAPARSLDVAGRPDGSSVITRDVGAPVVVLRDHELGLVVRDAVRALGEALDDFGRRVEWRPPPEVRERLLSAAPAVLAAALRDRQERGRRDDLRRARISTRLVALAQEHADLDEFGARCVVQLLTGPDPRNRRRNQHPSWYLTCRRWDDLSPAEWRSHAGHWASLLAALADSAMSEARRAVLMRRLSRGPAVCAPPASAPVPVALDAVQLDLWGAAPSRPYRRPRPPRPSPHPTVVPAPPLPLAGCPVMEMAPCAGRG